LVGIGIYAVNSNGGLDQLVKKVQGISAAAMAQNGPALSPEDQALSDKLQPFIKCMNGINTILREEYGGYKSYFQQRDSGNYDEHHAGSGNFSSSLTGMDYSTNKTLLVQCPLDLDAAIKAVPVDDDLDKNGAAYAEALRKLLPVLSNIRTYYDQANYRDDKMQHGRELDTQLRPIIAAVAQASDQIGIAIDTRNATLKEHELLAVEKTSGRNYEWQTLNNMIVARQAAVEIDAGGFDATGLKAIEARVQAAYDAGAAYAVANPVESSTTKPKPLWFDLDRNLSDFLTAIKQFRRDFEAGASTALSGDQARISAAFNRLVKTYNMMGRVRG
jgi:hypothetical protein